jgi:hypothetical protein
MSQEGRKYESGRVETEFSGLDDIEACVIVPVYVKQYHDNIPMLYVKPRDEKGAPLDVVLKTFRQVFIEEKTLPEDHIPYRVMLVDTLPQNANGKIDLFQISRGLISGKPYEVVEVGKSGKLSDFNMVPCKKGPSDMIEMVFDDIKEDIKQDLKNKMPASKLMRKIKKENPTMENKQQFPNFDPMCFMQQQMMNNMSGMMGQKFPMFNQCAPSFSTPEMQSMREMMPNMENVMPEMQKMAQTMYGMRPNVPAMLNNIAQAVLPILHQQTIQMFTNRNEMNQMAFEMLQRFCAQQSELDEKWFELAMKMFNAEQAEAEEAEEEAAEEVEAEVEEEEAEAEE